MPTNEIRLDWFTQLTTTWVAVTPSVTILLILMGLDIFSGTIASIVKKEISSKISLIGVMKKIGMLVLVFTGLVMELMYSDIPWGRVFALFFCSVEIWSITENLAKAGVPLPEQLISVLKSMKKQKGHNPLVGQLNIDQVQIQGAKVVQTEKPTSPEVDTISQTSPLQPK